MSTPKELVECTIPVLPVSDIGESIHFFTDKLGFKLDWGGPANGSLICSVSRDECAVMLSQLGMGSAPVWVWIGLDDESLFEEFRSCGVKVRQEPQNWSWAYEMKFEDPDGNVLWLGTEPRNDIPKVDDA